MLGPAADVMLYDVNNENRFLAVTIDEASVTRIIVGVVLFKGPGKPITIK